MQEYKSRLTERSPTRGCGGGELLNGMFNAGEDKPGWKVSVGWLFWR
jgi:hypothetical protein